MASPSAGVIAVLTALFGPPATQREIAERVGLTQPRVSQILRDLTKRGLAAGTRGEWTVGDRGAAFDCLAEASPPAAPTHWYGLAPVREQPTSVIVAARQAAVRYRLCGDWAADILAPWRVPGRVVVHLDHEIDLESAGFVTARPHVATLTTYVHDFRQSWCTPEVEVRAMAGSADFPWLAPVVEVAREIRFTGGADSEQAVAEIKRAWLDADRK